ncbi:hypothetical protein JTB14_034703 [Gonioctena quinquepunctata]|nr:hypothetical protein JTB14_034703 [Gonioctena quinquepunctata]
MRLDTLQLLIDLKNETKNSPNPITDEQMAAHIFSFFIAGIDTSASLISMTLYELSKNPGIQETVRREIYETMKKYNGELTMDCLNDMKYLRQVLHETLRLYPSLHCVTRKCVKNYKINGTNLVIEKGKCVTIPIIGIHRDPEYYPDPDKFDPERFNEKNKNIVNTELYFPFGIGPRMCIGPRFGFTVSQIGIINILREFRMSLSAKIRTPLEMNKHTFLLTFIDPVLLTAEKI